MCVIQFLNPLQTSTDGTNFCGIEPNEVYFILKMSESSISASERINLFLKELDTADVPRLRSSLDELNLYFTDHCKGIDFSPVIQTLDNRITEVEHDRVHQSQTTEMAIIVRILEYEISSFRVKLFQKTSTCLLPLKKRVEYLEELINGHQDQCYDVADIKLALNDIKVKIGYLATDNKVSFGWSVASLAVFPVCIGLSLIPVAGWLVAAVVGVVPFLGRLAHRLALSHRRKKNFCQTIKNK